jgi:hypothetical protein
MEMKNDNSYLLHAMGPGAIKRKIKEMEKN